jgi:hypothetical protein
MCVEMHCRYPERKNVMKREASDVSCREIDIQGHPPGSPDRLDISYSEFLHNARGKSWAFV